MKEKMTAIIKKILGNNVEVQFEKTTHDNGIISDSIIFKDDLSNENSEVHISPVLHFDLSKVNDDNVYEITSRICESYLNSKNNLKDNISSINVMECLTEEYAKDHVYPCVLNSDSNAEMIETLDLVHRNELDLSIIYRLFLSDNMSIKLSHKHLDMMNISVKQLDEYAFNNLKNDTLSLSLNSAIMNIMGVDVDDDDNCPLRILTNKGRYMGASAMFVEGIFKDKCYILPSSIHEVIYAPVFDGLDFSELKSMVSDINATVVSSNEKLSDHIYYFNGNNIEIIA